MVIASPRTGFRGQPLTPTAWPDEKEHLRLLAEAIRTLQETSRIYPVGIKSVTDNYTMTDLNLMILANATSTAITVTLQTAAARPGRRIIVKKTDSSNNLVTIDPAGSETLDGATTIALSQVNAVREYISDGTNWRLVAAIGNATEL
jgi:hypothetical protein